jgi:hypothetical protein
VIAVLSPSQAKIVVVERYSQICIFKADAFDK